MRSCLARVPPGVFPTKRIVLVLRVVSSWSCSPLFFLPLFFHLLLILAVSSLSTTSLSFFLFLGQSPISAQNRWISQGWLFCNSKSVLYHTNGRRIKVQYLGKLVFTCFVSYSQLYDYVTTLRFALLGINYHWNIVFLDLLTITPIALIP